MEGLLGRLVRTVFLPLLSLFVLLLLEKNSLLHLLLHLMQVLLQGDIGSAVQSGANLRGCGIRS